MLRKWEELPSYMQTEEVRPYYDKLKKKKFSLFFKRLFDIVAALIMLIVLSPIMIVIAIAIVVDSKGGVFFRQERVTQYGKVFRIHKFRTMVANADKKGAEVTMKNDARVTKVGKKIRKCRLDELPQVFDVLAGNMTFVGVRPEVSKYVDEYKNEWNATFLLPAGVTNLTCIYFKDEDELLSGVEDIDKVYIEKILPMKMKWNLKGIIEFSFWNDIKLMFMTVFAVCGKEYKKEC